MLSSLLLLLAAVVLLGSVSCAGGLMRFLQLAVPAPGRYKPILTDMVDISRPGDHARFELSLHRGEFYEIGLLSREGSIPASYSFQGEMQVRLSCNGVVFKEERIVKMGTRWYSDQGLTHYKRIGLLTFQPPDTPNCNIVTVDMTVLKGDPEYQKLATKPVLYVGISPTP